MMGLSFTHSNRIHELENQVTRLSRLNDRLQEKLAEEDSRSHMQTSMIESLKVALKKANEARHQAEEEVKRLSHEKLSFTVVKQCGVPEENHREVVRGLKAEIRRIGRDYAEQQDALRVAERFKSELKSFLGSNEQTGGCRF